jgi:hypothetical protein
MPMSAHSGRTPGPRSNVRKTDAQRAGIVLLAADGESNAQVARLVGVSLPTLDPKGAGQTRSDSMGHAVEAGPERLRHHLLRPHARG